jgi:hypothetical protein
MLRSEDLVIGSDFGRLTGGVKERMLSELGPISSRIELNRKDTHVAQRINALYRAGICTE